MADISVVGGLLVLYASLLCHAAPPPQEIPSLKQRASNSTQAPKTMNNETNSDQQVNRCSVEEHERVHCGQPNITAVDCSSINCCFDGEHCYYGNAVTVQCIRDGQFVVVIGKDTTLPVLNLESVQLLEGDESSCSPVGTTDSFTIFQFPFTTCGTRITEEDGYLIYENAMTSSYEVAIGPFGAITRDSQFELLFQCKFSMAAVEAMVIQVDGLPAPSPVVAAGPLRVELRLASGQCVSEGCVESDVAYTSYYNESDYPVTKVLREPVYVEVHILERADPNIVLILEQCWATSNSDPLSQPHWDLLVNGCPYLADHYLTTLVPVNGSSGLQFPTHYKRFIVKIFAFVDPQSLAPLKEMVFIHCSATVCYPTGSDHCEQNCNRKRRNTSLRREPSSDSVVVSSGELNIISM